MERSSMNQPSKKRLPASSEDWITHAKSDLKLARLGLNQDVLPEQICFHAQQAAEKAFKAVLLFSNIDFPFTRDVEALLGTMERAGISPPADVKDAGALTPYAVESRYPGYWGEISEHDMIEAVTLAEKTVAWAEGYRKCS